MDKHDIRENLDEPYKIQGSSIIVLMVLKCGNEMKDTAYIYKIMVIHHEISQYIIKHTIFNGINQTLSR